MENYLTLAEVASALGVEDEAAYQLVRSGAIEDVIYVPDSRRWFARADQVDAHRQTRQ